MKRPTDVHHRLPTSMGGTNDRRNIYVMNQVRHRAWHVLHVNKDPLQAVSDDFEEFAAPILSIEMAKEIRKDLVRVLSEGGYAYQNGILIPERFEAGIRKYKNR